ncbi:MAG: IPTL-CTERM sorting domain-containing protein [Planctomycetota bacterium]|jgi:hypothetical protein
MSKKSMLLISLVLLLGVLAGTSAAQEPVEDVQNVPTLSQWGLIVMGVALVTVGAIVIVRRKRRIAA